MPHYADGTEAKVKDRVRGKGYNIKGPDGLPAEFEGIVVGITPGAGTCNVRVATLRPATDNDFMAFRVASSSPPDNNLVAIEVEYGQADAFRKV